MNYLADLYNAKELYNVSHKEKANEVILGISVYRFIKNRIRHMNWDAKFDNKGILREVLGLNIKIDYFYQNLIEVRRNVYLNDPFGFIWLYEEEMKKEVDDDLVFKIVYIISLFFLVYIPYCYWIHIGHHANHCHTRCFY